MVGTSNIVSGETEDKELDVVRGEVDKLLQCRLWWRHKVILQSFNRRLYGFNRLLSERQRVYLEKMKYNYRRQLKNLNQTTETYIQVRRRINYWCLYREGYDFEEIAFKKKVCGDYVPGQPNKKASFLRLCESKEDCANYPDCERWVMDREVIKYSDDVRYYIGLTLQELCRSDPSCPFKPMLPENPSPESDRAHVIDS